MKNINFTDLFTQIQTFTDPEVPKGLYYRTRSVYTDPLGNPEYLRLASSLTVLVAKIYRNCSCTCAEKARTRNIMRCWQFFQDGYLTCNTLGLCSNLSAALLPEVLMVSLSGTLKTSLFASIC